MDFPPIPLDVLKALERAFPESSPDERETHDQLMVRAGSAKVVRLLQHHYAQQQENILSPENQDVHT